MEFFFVFFVFSRFLALGVKNKKKPEKTKNKKNKTLDTIWLPPWPHVVCGVFFFGLLEVFGTLGQTPKKEGSSGRELGLVIFFAVCFFLFSFIFLENQQK